MFQQEFSAFYGLKLNKDNCAYFAVNVPPASLRWKASDEDRVKRGDSFENTIGKGGKLINITMGGGRPVGRGDGREMKYLGVWFEPGRGWRKQGRVLEATYRFYVDPLAGVSIALQHMVYIINAVVVPSLTYSLVIATVAQGTMDNWDKGLRRLVAKSGGLPKTLPVHLYYVPVEEGGLGLRSVVDTVDRLKVMAYMSAGDDLDLGDRGAEWKVRGRCHCTAGLLNRLGAGMRLVRAGVRWSKGQWRLRRGRRCRGWACRSGMWLMRGTS